MTRHLRPADIRLADFLVVSWAVDAHSERLYTVTSRKALLERSGAAHELDGATSIHSVCLADGVASDITEDLAQAWYDQFGGAYEAIPEIFAPFLEDRQHKDNERAEDPTGIIARGEREYEERAGK